MRAFCLLAALFPFIFGGVANAQDTPTEEEVVVFLFIGIEHERNIKYKNGDHVTFLKVIEDPPAYKFQSTLHPEQLVFFNIEKEGKCKYRFFTSLDLGGKPEGRQFDMDFSGLRQIQVVRDGTEGLVALHGANISCKDPTGDQCNLGDYTHYFVPDQSRLNNALNYYKKSFCAGKPY